MSKTSPTAAAVENPFFETWTTPFGVPPFSRMKPEHFMPAFERAFAEHQAEIVAIAGLAEPPSFENTIVALELGGRALQRVDEVSINSPLPTAMMHCKRSSAISLRCWRRTGTRCA